MQFDWVELVRLVHIASAAVWAGGAIFATLALGPAVRAAGPAGGAFMGAVMKRGGFGKVFAPFAWLTILGGAVLYWKYGYHNAPFATVSNGILTIGVLVALATFGVGMIYGMPLQKRMTAIAQGIGPTGPTPEQAKELGELGARMMRFGKYVPYGLGLALVLMIGRTIVY